MSRRQYPQAGPTIPRRLAATDSARLPLFGRDPNPRPAAKETQSRTSANRISRMRARCLLCFFLTAGAMSAAACRSPEQRQVAVVSADDIAWLEAEARRQLAGCVIEARDGTPLYTPDGQGHYAALWTRDFAYMVENAHDLIPADRVRRGILYLLAGQREDGCIPDRVQADGLAVYSAGPLGKPLGDPPTDNSQFMVKLVADYVRATGDLDFFRGVAGKLVRAMDFAPRSRDGLVTIDPARPHSPYGFTDTIAKTGELLFSSLLYWEASRRLASLFEKAGDAARGGEFEARAASIERNLVSLWDEKVGMFMAASVDCRQIDIWGNAYAVYAGFPLGPKRERIIHYLAGNYSRVIYRGQVRHLPEPEVWGKTLIPVAPETYQNGAYWGTASGWIAFALKERRPDLAALLIRALITDYKRRGAYECVNAGYEKLRDYVVSVVNPLGALRRMSLERDD